MFISEPEKEEDLLNVIPFSYENCGAKNEVLKGCLRYLEWVVGKEFRRENAVYTLLALSLNQYFTHWSRFFCLALIIASMVVVTGISSKYIFLNDK